MAKKKKKGGDEEGAGWIMTFADLMSLLLTFFVLLLSFADMDIKRYRMISASLKEALGVQREYVAEQIPHATSVVKQEFEAGKKTMVEFEAIDHRFSVQDAQKRDFIEAYEEQKDNETIAKQEEKEISKILKEEIENQNVKIERQGSDIVIRIQERVLFDSGKADLKRRFGPLLLKISKALRSVKGNIEVVGHTDDRPINTSRFRSNWELSTSRAVSVAHAVLKVSQMKPERFTIMGKGETQPVATNGSRNGRASNRRVEIVIKKGKDRKISSETESL